MVRALRLESTFSILPETITSTSSSMVRNLFTFDVDVSDLPCGMNGALYLSAMEMDGGRSKLNPAGATYGTGYCDAQCFNTSAFINGVANVNELGACCNEMDIWVSTYG